MPVLGDRPVLGKQQAGAGAVYYIVIPHKSLIFRGFGHMHLAVLQSASFRIIRIRTHFRHFRNGPAVYGLLSIPPIHQPSFCACYRFL